MKNKKTNILFLCKHNVFRSKVAEASFRKLNKDKSIKATSAGFIKADVLLPVEKKLMRQQRETAKKFGLNLRADSKNLRISLVNKQDIIVIVADDVPNIFTSPFYLKPNLKVIKWKIPDVKGTRADKKIILNDIKRINKKVEDLVKKLEAEK